MIDHKLNALLLITINSAFICDARTSSCHYSLNRVNRLVAHCENQGFTFVPRNLIRHIQELDLSINMIKTLENGTFENYSILEILILNHNRISEVHINAFVGLPNLKALKIRGNFINITKLPTGVFSPLDNLTTLDIGRNEEQSPVNQTFVYPDKTFSALQRLRFLSLDLFMYPEFGDGFRSLQILTVLNFDRCYLKNIDSFILSNSTFRNFSPMLNELYIRRCLNFFRIDKGILHYFPELKVLDLSNSNIHLYQALNILQPFQNKKMSVINLHHISSKSVNNDEFPYSVIVTKKLMKYLRTICVEALDLSKTGIVDDQLNSLFSFQYPECFKTFIISSNRLPSTNIEHYMETVIFLTKATNMKTYDMSYLESQFLNPVYLDVYHPEKFIPKHEEQQIFQMPFHISFKIPPSLEFVRFTHMSVVSATVSITCANSSLKYFDISYSVFEQYPIVQQKCGKQLRYLDVSGISSTMIFQTIPLPRLTTLKMTHASIDRSIFEGKQWMLEQAPALKNVDISFNNLWTLKDTELLNTSGITHLNMSNNLFRSVPTCVSKLRHLKSLDLSNNLITSVDKTIRKWLDEIIESTQNFSLDLNNNAFVCSCTTLDFMLWLTKTPVSFVNGNNYTCTMSNNTQVNLMEVTKDIKRYFADCNATVWLRIGIVLISCIVGVSIPLSIVYYYRWKLILYMFRKFRRAVERGLHVNYEYDVYVSYEERSITWIKNNLLPKTEQEWGLKICLHDRDHLPGEHTSESKALSIHHSRHVIFIITENFNECEWGKFEIERAKYEKYTKNLMKIIVILQNVNVIDIPEQLVDISNDVYFIEWHVDETGICEHQTEWFRLKTLLFLN
ncbi:TLR2 [Mytilus coruscus]|uniref:TLR2 n=1 Tax=Mytilus coruscus TaxID=42192 RepID=A0A6J8DFS4_MYTCO|nr:TLR2 [Mytilus coruscus]